MLTHIGGGAACMVAEESAPGPMALTRRRFLSLVALSGAGAAVAASAPRVASASSPPKDTLPEEEGRRDGAPEPIAWEKRKAQMLRSHEETVAYSREG